MRLWQWAIVRRNGETWVTWSETKDEALAEFTAAGYRDAWHVVRMPRSIPAAP